MLRHLIRWKGFLHHGKRKRLNGSTRRRLRPEALERRQLLAANILQNELVYEDIDGASQLVAFESLTANDLSNQQGRGDRSRNPPERGDDNAGGGDRAVDESAEDGTSSDSTSDVVADDTDVVLQWNDVFGEVLVENTEFQNPGYASRSQAILNLAIYDTVAATTAGANANTFYDYAIDFSGAENLDTEIAASQAAYTVLSSLYPDQQAALDEAVQSSLSGAVGDASFSESVALGTEIANTILSIRADDGSDAIGQYVYTNEAGDFQPDPFSPNVPAWGPLWGEVETFAISNSDDFLPRTTPALDSEEYAASYNEVLDLGAADSETRTAEQTEIGVFWAYDVEGLGTPIALFNDILQTIAVQEGNTLEENAALFAQASVAMADAGIVAWDTKFTEEFWRPVTAIHDGDTDGNDLTEGDPDWIPLGAPDGNGDEIGFTPQFPTYISGHATFGAALFGTLQQFYGTDDIAFEVASDELEILLADPDLQEAYGLDLEDATRSFSSFSEAMAENGRSRVYLGVHFNFDDTVGQEVGQAIAASVASAFVVASDDSTVDDNPVRDGQMANHDDGQNRRDDNRQNNDRTRRSQNEDRFAAIDSVFANNFFRR
jgi:hypothetical protein